MQIYNYHRIARSDAPGVAQGMISVLRGARTFADVGAGSGLLAAELCRRGKDVIACEHSLAGRLIARAQGVKCYPFDLANATSPPIKRTVDVAYCFEVAEHVPPELSERLVNVVADLAQTVIFTAAPPGVGGLGHINEQPSEYWVSKFTSVGLTPNPRLQMELMRAFATAGAESEWFLTRVMVFSKAAEC